MTAAPALTLDGFHPEFADLAAHMAEQRVIHADSFGERQIFVMAAIAEIWRCAANTLTPQRRLMAVTRDEALGELAAAIEVANRNLRRRPDDRLRALRLEQLRAMRWWHGDFGAAAHALNMVCMLRHRALQRSIEEQGRAAA